MYLGDPNSKPARRGNLIILIQIVLLLLQLALLSYKQLRKRNKREKRSKWTVQNLTDSKMILINLTNKQFDPLPSQLC